VDLIVQPSCAVEPCLRGLSFSQGGRAFRRCSINYWFEAELLPVLKAEIARLTGTGAADNCSACIQPR